MSASGRELVYVFCQGILGPEPVEWSSPCGPSRVEAEVRPRSTTAILIALCQSDLRPLRPFRRSTSHPEICHAFADVVPVELDLDLAGSFEPWTQAEMRTLQ